eukprot:gene8217-9064_t
MRRLFFQQAKAAAKAGLFGLSPRYGTPEGFRTGAKEAMEKIQEVKALLTSRGPLGSSSLSPSAVLHLLDTVSNDLCCVIDAAEACRNLHTDGAFLQSAQEAFETISAFIAELNSDPKLYQLLCEVVGDASAWEGLTEEERAFALDLKRDFEVDGIHLSDQLQAQLKALQAAIVQAETAFSQNNMNLTESAQVVSLGPFPHQPAFQRLSVWLDRYHPQSRQDTSRSYLTTSLDRRIVYPLLRSVEEEEVRKSLWTCSSFAPCDNAFPLLELIGQRHRYARLLGYRCYAERSLLKNIYKRPEEVEELLREVARVTRSQAMADLQLLQRNKALVSQAPLQPWDVAFFQQQVSTQRVHSGNSAQNALRAFLPLGLCLDSLRDLTQTLFGLRVCKSSPERGESWLEGGGQEVHKWEVWEEEEEGRQGRLLGVVYLDLFARAGKFPGAAHFIVQCGCDALQLPSLTSSRQLPVVVLSFQLSTPKPYSTSSSSSSSSTSSAEGSGGLSLQELETLYHEWGHALHSLCSKTHFQHLSGTRGGTDFIEIPSHLTEQFARDERWLLRFARHSQTGAPPSAQLVQQALQAESFTGLRTQTQLLYAAADQALFGPRAATAFLQTDRPDRQLEEVMRLIAQAQQDFTVLPVGVLHAQRDGELVQQVRTLLPSALQAVRLEDMALPMMNPFAHTHLINYGGSYYSYLLAKAYAAQIWQHLFRSDPLDRRAGQIFRDRFLAFGASADSQRLLDEVAGGPLDVSCYLRSLDQTSSSSP